MARQEGDFRGPRGIRIRWQGWLPEVAPRAVLLLVHGLAEHSGRYGNLVGHLLPPGYAVYGVDHIGHGKSAGARVFVERFEDFLAPLDTLHGLAGSQDKTLKIYPGLYHEIYNEPERGRVLDDVGNWLAARCG